MNTRTPSRIRLRLRCSPADSPPPARRTTRPAAAGDTSLGPNTPSNVHAHRRATAADPPHRRCSRWRFARRVEATGNVAFNGDNSTQVLSPVSGPAIHVIVANPARSSHAATPLADVSSPDFATAVADYRKARRRSATPSASPIADSALFKNDALARD